MADEHAAAWWFAFQGSELLVHSDDSGFRIPSGPDLAHLGLAPQSSHLIGEMQGRPCFAAELPGNAVPPPGAEFKGLRSIWGNVGQEAYRLAGKAVQIVEWDRTHRFCSACGAPTILKQDEGAKACPACGALYFPRLSPAVIVLIRDGERALLARSHRFPPGRYSTVAGFVEPGETLEEAAEREIMEEVGVRVKNLTYFGSQPWPFPHSLMVGFTAEYAGGEIRLQESEIADARWFTPDAMPDLPPPLSIARRLIDWFLSECRRP